MSDHADTIHRYLCSVDNDPYKAEDALDDLVAELENLRAERQQAIDERDAARKRLDVLQRYDEDSLVSVALECDRLDARCEQAIAALREIASDDGDCIHKFRARQLLVSLGEKPTP